MKKKRTSLPLVHVIIGTRADAIKMAPIFLALLEREDVQTRLISSGQHRELLEHALKPFVLKPDVDLAVMKAGQGLAQLTGRLLDGFDKLFDDERPAMVLVHGDTTTCFAAALSAFYRGVPIAHVEAGLRTYRLDSPFPEELNRQLVGRFAALHLATNAEAEAVLLAEQIAPYRIRVVGSSIEDALAAMLARAPEPPHASDILFTLHRRENRSEKLIALMGAVLQAAEQNPDKKFLLPLHPAPELRREAERIFGDCPNMTLCKALPYDVFVATLARTSLVLTDSGGVQEEAVLLGKPVIVLRERTEREPASGTQILGDDPSVLPKMVARALKAKPPRSRVSGNLFAKTTASQRIAEAIVSFLEKTRAVAAA